MRDKEQRTAIKKFVEYWSDKGYEKGESQPFWIELLGNVFGVENPAHYIKFEEQVHLDHTSFIDGFIPSTHVLIEQKGAGKDLRKAIKQSDGSSLTPFQQAQRYSAVLPYSKRPRWIITCNFEEFLIYDMEKPTGEPESILLKNLEKEYYRLQFLVDAEDENIKKEMEISIQAGDIVGMLYDELLKQYLNPNNEDSLKSLNMLCVRLVFCLYAEDAGIFGGHNKFHNYLKNVSAKDARRALIDLFKVLDTKPEERDPYMDKALLDFPYVNGGLFADENIEIPQLNEKILNLILEKASEDFDWSGISPTIFGAVFESTLNPETRRSGGMHYTSIENIHKVIAPLFLDELREEFDSICSIKVGKVRENKIEAFREKLASLTFLDPACGSGNFLTETYMSLRRLENEALLELTGGQMLLDLGNVIKVSIGQFYGIEINDFAVTVAKTALWIAESQMLKETESIINMDLDFLPLKSYANIVEGNALRIDWESVVPKNKLNYIMGNPPFVGARLMSKEQKEDLLTVFGAKWKNAGNLDYVSCWYKKSVDLMEETSIRTALVSTNSVVQGDSVAILWKQLFEKGVHIDFAHQTFHWESEANNKAQVYCVIIGFSIAVLNRKKIIYSSERPMIAANINAYLIDAPNTFIESKSLPLCNVPKMDFGSMPNDGGFLSNYSRDEKDMILNNYPEAEPMFKKIVGAQEFINNTERYCLWLKGISPKDIKQIPPIIHAVENVRQVRSNSNREATRKLAETPTLFGEIRQPETDYLLIPSATTQKRKYIPIGFMNKDVISTNLNLIISNANLYHFGVLTSNVHMCWMRAVCGRLGDNYRYSIKIVYNNFPWPTPTAEQQAKIEKTAQAILDARALYPDCSLADLYDELTMPPELRKAHQENDRAVMQAYGFDVKSTTESSCVAELMKMYQELTK
ncbi:MAG: class I SAM-dependent DNA methyltransferase [Ruminococcaceae bacterium]|nr:class I SAM-dependent DNA methyltransferase [Oscillospiraceae bacterium]